MSTRELHQARAYVAEFVRRAHLAYGHLPTPRERLRAIDRDLLAAGYNELERTVLLAALAATYAARASSPVNT
jgi:hypothetical protein